MQIDFVAESPPVQDESSQESVAYPFPINYQPEKKRKKKIHSEEPSRDPVAIYNAKNEEVQLSWREDERKVSNDYQTEKNLRQTSRRRFKEGIIRQMYKLKLVCDDDSYIVFKSHEKKTEEIFKTDKTESLNNSTLVPPPTSSTPLRNSTTEDLNVFELARISPSKTMAKPTGPNLCNMQHKLSRCLAWLRRFERGRPLQLLGTCWLPWVCQPIYERVGRVEP